MKATDEHKNTPYKDRTKKVENAKFSHNTNVIRSLKTQNTPFSVQGSSEHIGETKWTKLGWLKKNIRGFVFHAC